MTLLLAILFFAFVIGAVIRGHFSYSNVEYSFHEHPIQYIIVLIAMLGAALLCTYLFIKGNL